MPKISAYAFLSTVIVNVIVCGALGSRVTIFVAGLTVGSEPVYAPGAGLTMAARLMLPAKPFSLVRVIVKVPVEFSKIVSGPVVVVKVKSQTRTRTVVASWERAPLFPVTVTV
jgi:hypothetical protein